MRRTIRLIESEIWNETSVKALKDSVNKISKALPQIKFSKITDSKYSGPRVQLSFNNTKTYMYIDDSVGLIIGNKYNSYSGNINEIIEYLKKRLEITKSNLQEKASIDWNNYLTPGEIKKFKAKDDKIEAAGEIIYDKAFKDRFEDFKKSGWTDEQLIDDLFEFDLNKHLTEGEHLFAFVKDEDGNDKIIEDSDYPDKKSFKADLIANGYKVRRINTDRDMFIMDNSDYRSENEVITRIKQIERDIKNGIALPSQKIELSNLKALLSKLS